MYHFDFVLVFFRKGRSLPCRRRNTKITISKCKEGGRVLEMNRDMSIGASLGKLRIEPDVPALRAVKELAVEQETRVRKYGPQRQCLTPAGMRHDHVRHESRC